MTEEQTVRVSKFLSKHLRHSPEAIGLTLEEGGWVGVEELLSAMQRKMPLTREQLDAVVANNNKQRFAFDATGTKIRANQGHSVEVDLQLAPAVPPAVLYHGTGHGAVESILREGLQKRNRHHVHLAAETETARKVGMRHGRPVILTVDTVAMVADGYVFYCSENGVWLTEAVPTQYLTVL